MPFAELDGISTRYETIGSGPALLMFSPGGFDSSLDNWTAMGRYRELGLVEQLAKEFTCVVFDRRESGQSGGRIERLTWNRYVRQATALLDHLGIGRAHLMGGCVGCSTAAALAVAEPARVISMVLFSPAGGVHYRRAQLDRFARHLAFVSSNGLAAVVDLARSTTDGFSSDPRVGPWAHVLRHDDTLAVSYAAFDQGRYEILVDATARLLFDRDTVSGPEPEDLMVLDTPTLIVPGQDRSHAPSAARYLQECLPNNEFWDLPVVEQTSANVPGRLLEFLSRH